MVTEFPTPNIELTLLPGVGLRLAASGLEPLIEAEYEAEIKFA